MIIEMIACIGKNNELGMGNDLIWHYKEDMQFFKKYTTGNIVVMGRKTYDSLPFPYLKDRVNIVLSRQRKDLPKEVLHFSNIFDLLETYKDTTEKLIIIGGGNVYKQFLPLADKLILTEVHKEEPKADTFFPDFRNDFTAQSNIMETEDFTIRVYTRNVARR